MQGFKLGTNKVQTIEEEFVPPYITMVIKKVVPQQEGNQKKAAREQRFFHLGTVQLYTRSTKQLVMPGSHVLDTLKN